ncbi:hypothetical protein PPACK8108_LOCUS203 [Phakopsora pachyrhizi]|uniref:Replication protein A C-terminal domain-containing protein n=1 Tax=Phakopsora pachyrhizi TaxID=170000 RepID=A0AAV0AFY0_PHAPC|nr:hypothetical protein PPACK8108_LOCUS203 [Phakopsora pachyrhizi]
MTSYSSRFNNNNDDFGGGFMQNGSQLNNLNSPGGGNRRQEMTLRPMTIKQLLESEPSNTDSSLVIQDTEISNVSICGVVRDISRNPTTISLHVEDGTGGIEVRKWIDSSDGESEGLDLQNGIQEHDWIKIIGSPKVFNGKRHVSGLRLLKIEDFNQINYHFLDVVKVTLTIDRGSSNSNGINSMNIDRKDSNNLSRHITNPAADSRNPSQNKILNFFRTLNDIPDEGVNVREISRGCSLDMNQVYNEIGKLIAEGELYTTIDDEHVMTTAALY